MKLSWLKLSVDIIDDQKIKRIRRMPGGDSLAWCWIAILCMAMRSNRPGFLLIGKDFIANFEDVAAAADVENEVAKSALIAFEKLGMVKVCEDGLMEVANFREHQSIDRIEYQRERNRLKQANFRSNNSNRLLTGIENKIETKKENKKKNKEIPEPKVSATAMIDLFYKLHEEKTSLKPTGISFPAFHASYRSAIKGGLTEEALSQMLFAFFNDDYAARAGYPSKLFWGNLNKYHLQNNGVGFNAITKISQNQIEHQRTMEKIKRGEL